MRMIPLTKGESALVDDEDFDRLAVYRWQLHETGGKRYARRTYVRDGKSVGVYMHRSILETSLEVDHIDGNGLNNCKSNLRPATRSQQTQWRSKNRNKSLYKGVYKQSRSERFYAKIEHMGVSYGLGTYDTPEEAAAAYDRKAKELFGDYARLNIPDEEAA